MTSSLVGSEMCIRDSYSLSEAVGVAFPLVPPPVSQGLRRLRRAANRAKHCLLYTSDAADDM
eukprot:9026192-Prorocentrum_lima.AAC.1